VDNGQSYWMLDGKVKELTKRFKITKHQVVVKVKGSALAGKRYVPLFDYFAEVRRPFHLPLAFWSVVR